MPEDLRLVASWRIHSCCNRTGENLKVTLSGTGSVRPRVNRLGPSVLVEAGSESLLFDCGRGASERLFQLQIP